ncbi:hypothetical protein NE237_028857 [Protea cynaroides]|uniref:Uncharacterized protein n=1 Tax=Protea cynaroides TaxID=273540 RepID=A0A9Q0JVJ5_9MAGN|nr:hypothetical protein NE237_028857 [Protea cynaroides]
MSRAVSIDHMLSDGVKVMELNSVKMLLVRISSCKGRNNAVIELVGLDARVDSMPIAGAVRVTNTWIDGAAGFRDLQEGLQFLDAEETQLELKLPAGVCDGITSEDFLGISVNPRVSDNLVTGNPRLVIKGTPPTPPTGQGSPGSLFVCNHRHGAGPIIIAIALGRKVSCVAEG